MSKILIRFRHGLGDVVQLSVVLKHIHHYWPDTEIDVEVHKGMENIFGPLANGYPLGQAPGVYDTVYNLDWRESLEAEGHVPSTKITRALKQNFGLPELCQLYRYEIHIPKESRKSAKRFFDALPTGKGHVVIHYQGKSSQERKNLDDDTIRWLCQHLIDRDYVPVILDWDRRSPIPDNKSIFRADHLVQQDAGGIAALIDRAALFVGIDSGPLHIAGGLKTPSIGVWTQHHPVKYFDLADNVLHLVPQDARKFLRISARHRGQEFFHGNYRHEYYSDLPYHVVSSVCKALHIGLPTGNPMEMAWLLTSTAYDQKYYQEHKDAGLDYLAYGSWQQNYAMWLAETLDLKTKHVLDVGCACGAITRGLVDSGVDALGVDVCEHMVKLGQEHWDGRRLFVCDCINLHLFENNHFDCIHTHQVAEHLRPDYIPLILAEFNRVTKMGGRLLLFLDTTELFERQGRHMHDEDPTHICIKPRNWWKQRLELAGWSDHTSEDRSRMDAHRMSYFQQYDWEFLSFHKTRNVNHVRE